MRKAIAKARVKRLAPLEKWRNQLPHLNILENPVAKRGFLLLKDLTF